MVLLIVLIYTSNSSVGMSHLLDIFTNFVSIFKVIAIIVGEKWCFIWILTIILDD